MRRTGIPMLALHFVAAVAAAAPAAAPLAPDAGGPRAWRVSAQAWTLALREEPSRDAQPLARYTPGTVLSNLGCKLVAGEAWCDVQELAGGPRGYVAAAYLEPAVGPDGRVPTGPDDSPLRAAEGKFDATGQVPCAMAKAQPTGQCDFGVARGGGGYATVEIRRPDGRTRAIFFALGRPISADSSQADGYGEFRASRVEDLHRVEVGNERYEIPDAVVNGG